MMLPRRDERSHGGQPTEGTPNAFASCFDLRVECYMKG